MVRKEGDSKIKSSMRRRPLRDVSNGGIKSTNKKKIKLNIEEDEQPQHFANNQDPLDRLLLVHSDISSLLRQIDELVVQAVNVDTSDSDRITEIKSFTLALSEIHSSLKPWVPRLQKALTVTPTKSKSQICETSVGASPVSDQGGAHAVDTPAPSRHESLISPSPLVSWRATDAEERGKQLFFLTPLLRAKTTTSKAQAPPKLTASEGIASNTISIYPSPHASNKSNCEKFNVVSENLESTSDIGLVPYQNIPVGDISTTLITPRLKNPPVRTYVLHEPTFEVSYRKMTNSHISTPFPTGNNKLYESTDSEGSSGEVREKLGLKYRELIGLKPSFMSNKGSRALEASPAWIMSPPKCCKLLEPLDEKHPKDETSVQELASTFNQQLSLAPPMECNTKKNNQDKEDNKICLQGSIRSNFAIVESTPLWKGCESTIRRGKRPGENTLKRELWTRFEAASMDECPPNFSAFEDSSHKGFLERLEEASCEADPDAFR